MSKHHNADHYFLDRAGQRRLRDKLAEVPDLVDELAITTTRQARPNRSDLDKPRSPRRKESALPLHLGSAAATTELHNCLAGWVRVVTEERGIDYRGNNSIIGLARWLEVNMISLAMTEGSQDAPEDIIGRMLECETIIDLPRVVIDPVRVQMANKKVVTASTIDRVVADIGEMGEGLNAARIRTLEDAEVLKPAGRFENRREKFYLLGDVLHAHVSYPTRQKRDSA